MDRFFIIDGNSILNRAYYGIRLLTTKEGLYTNAVYGFLNIFFKNLDELSPKYVAVAFDLPAPTFRHKAYDKYKANRKGMPDELAAQLPLIKEVLSAMNVTILEKEGYEADDIIGTVSKMCEEKGVACNILTGDKDDLQLASDKTKVLLTITRQGNTTTEMYDADKVYEKYGVTPTEFIDVKGLMGDSSDNIPGVSGIGEKTAFSLISEHKSIEALYENMDNCTLTPSVKKKLTEGRDMAVLSKSLATIDRNVPLDVCVSDCEKKEPDADALRALFEKLEFKSFMPRVGAPKKETVEPACEAADPFSLQMALTGLSKFYYLLFFEDGEFSAAAFLDADNKPVYSELPIDYYKEIFEDETIEKIGHDIKEDMTALSRQGINYRNEGFDTMLAAYLLESSSSDYELSDLIKTYLGRDVAGIKESLGKGKSRVCIKDYPEKLTLAAGLVTALPELSAALFEKMKENEEDKLYFDVELPLVRVLSDMQIEGFTVDRDSLSEFSKQLGERLSELEGQITALAGGEFKINSTKQLGEVLFEKLGLPVVKKTKTGYSTDADVLEKLRDKHPIVDLILEYRQLGKLKSTYADGLAAVIDEKTGKIHSTFCQTVTSTGRISSTEPNLQNIPVRMELGRRVRKMFTAPSRDYVLIDADYSQIELRVLAHMAEDENMIAGFLHGDDIHRITAAQVFGVDPRDVTDAMRTSAKAVNFGIVYGIGDFSLAQDIGVTRTEARQYIDAYLETYSGVREYMKEVVAFAKKTGYAKTMLGRRRYIPELSSSNFNLRSFGERAAMNMPIQGSAADIIKIAMVRVSKALSEKTKDSRLILQVHDELIVCAHKDEAHLAAKIVKEEMENAYPMRVPLVADVNTGFSWYETK